VFYGPKVQRFTQPRATPWGYNANQNIFGPTGQPFSFDTNNCWPVGPKNYRYFPSPGRCPGLGERSPFQGGIQLKCYKFSFLKDVVFSEGISKGNCYARHPYRHGSI
jgi:hypothetical protein